MSYRYRCTRRQNGRGDIKKPCGARRIFTQAQHDRAKAGEEFKCTCGGKLKFTKADYTNEKKRVCNCGGRPKPHRRGQRGCTHDTRGFASEDDYRDYVESMQRAFS